MSLQAVPGSCSDVFTRFHSAMEKAQRAEAMEELCDGGSSSSANRFEWQQAPWFSLEEELCRTHSDLKRSLEEVTDPAERTALCSRFIHMDEDFERTLAILQGKTVTWLENHVGALTEEVLDQVEKVFSEMKEALEKRRPPVEEISPDIIERFSWRLGWLKYKIQDVSKQITTHCSEPSSTIERFETRLAFYAEDLGIRWNKFLRQFPDEESIKRAQGFSRVEISQEEKAELLARWKEILSQIQEKTQDGYDRERVQQAIFDYLRFAITTGFPVNDLAPYLKAIVASGEFGKEAEVDLNSYRHPEGLKKAIERFILDLERK